jgi:DNA-binding NarL/FixJ family response regulator
MTRILIIEDDPHFRATLRGLLAERFPAATLLECETGEEALEQLERFSPDLVLTDLKLPGQDGFQVTRRIRSLLPELPVIVLTCFHEPEYQEAAYSAGATHFASKHESSAREILILVETSLCGGEEPVRDNPTTV